MCIADSKMGHKHEAQLKTKLTHNNYDGCLDRKIGA